MILAIIQARMGSSRLPGKVLMPLGNNTILGHLLSRLKPSKKVHRFVVATTNNPEDQAIEEYCQSHSVTCYRGSDWDVLERFYLAATENGATTDDTIVRICCDNPLHSWKVMDQVIENFLTWGVDYCSNSNQEPDFLEDGFDVEVTSFDALQSAYLEATLLSEREHVMPYIKNSKKFKLGWKKTNSDYRFKFSVDTPEDLQMAKTIFDHFHNQPDFSIDEVTQLILDQPELLRINASSRINAGYQKSLSEDKKVK
jgi:spore coat polysaccharide biosynthesis protein SpsF (cytidylyltransferase family)